MIRTLISTVLLGLSLGASAGTTINLDWGDMPVEKAEKCMDFWQARDYEVTFIGEGKSVYCAVVIPELNTEVPDREAQVLLRREAKSLGVKIDDLTPAEIFGVFRWKYRMRGVHELEALKKNGMGSCPSNPHQPVCRK